MFPGQDWRTRSNSPSYAILSGISFDVPAGSAPDMPVTSGGEGIVAPSWVSGEWGECSASCKDSGTRARDVYCADKDDNTVPDGECDLSSKPAGTETCGDDKGCFDRTMTCADLVISKAPIYASAYCENGTIHAYGLFGGNYFLTYEANKAAAYQSMMSANKSGEGSYFGFDAGRFDAGYGEYELVYDLTVENAALDNVYHFWGSTEDGYSFSGADGTHVTNSRYVFTYTRYYTSGSTVQEMFDYLYVAVVPRLTGVSVSTKVTVGSIRLRQLNNYW